MLRIRLTRRGSKKDPHYRVVVTERSNPRDGRFNEIVGYYNPAMDPVRLHLDLARIDYWLQNGAQPSETVRTLIRRTRSQQEVPEKPQEEPVTQDA